RDGQPGQLAGAHLERFVSIGKPQFGHGQAAVGVEVDLDFATDAFKDQKRAVHLHVDDTVDLLVGPDVDQFREFAKGQGSLVAQAHGVALGDSAAFDLGDLHVEFTDLFGQAVDIDRHADD